MAEIWAKSVKKSKGTIAEPPTLSEHIQDILTAFKNIEDKIADCEIKQAIRFAIVFHDLGKVIPRFQIVSLKNTNYEPYNVIDEIPHSLFSIFWIDEDSLKLRFKDKNECDESRKEYKKLVKFIISALAYHHWRESFDDYINVNDEAKRFFKWVLENKNILERNLKEELKKLKNLEALTDIIKLQECKIREVLNGIKLYNFAIPPYKFDYEVLRHTLIQSKEDYRKWVLIAGFLQRCDHFASWCESEGEDLNNIEIKPVNENKIKKSIKNKIHIEDENKIWQIQVADQCKNKNLILIAPTGYGKTEFAFLWSAGNKFIYTLPLRSAVNQIFNRSQRIFGEDKVGLLHSDADVHLLEKYGDVEDNMKYYQLAKNLSYPVIISTGDQFFPYALKPPGFEKIFSIFSYANLVIDEVQAYDPVACAIIVKFIEWVSIMGGKFLLMTATLPEFVKKEIEKRIGEGNSKEENIYEKGKNKFEKIIKHKLNLRDINNQKGSFDIPDDILDEMIKHAEKGQRVLVIMNTVPQAQKVYEKLKEKIDKKLNEETDEENKRIYEQLKNKIFLIHSRFTLEDRRKKEVELIEKEFKNSKPQDENEGKILVATQVVEASLDIDADVLYTEICPLDALVQRMGRVLRRISASYEFEKEDNGKRIYKSSLNENQKYEVDLSKPNIHIFVFKNGLESGNGRVYDKELLELSKEKLKDYSKEISEYEKFELVSSLYECIKEKATEYLEEFYNTLEILSAGYMSDRKSDAQKVFRKIYDVDVIPENLLEKFIEAVKDFVEKYMPDKAKDKDNLYTLFKAEVLSKFVVSIPYRDIERLNWIYYDVEKELPDDNIKKRLKSWLSGIYKIDKNYDEEKGMFK